MVSRSLGGRIHGEVGQGGGQVLQQLLLLRLPGEAEVRNFALYKKNNGWSLYKIELTWNVTNS